MITCECCQQPMTDEQFAQYEAQLATYSPAVQEALVWSGINCPACLTENYNAVIADPDEFGLLSADL